MPFGNPAVGGTDLVRNAIQSPNYQTGVSGWIARRDGSAEFTGNVIGSSASFDSLSANSEFYYQGNKLSDLLAGNVPANQPGRIVGFGPSIAGVRSFASNTKQLFTQISFTYHAGRRYALLIDPFSYSANAAGYQPYIFIYYKDSTAGNCATTDPHIQYDYDTTAYSGDAQTLAGKLQDVEWPGTFVDGHNYNLAFSIENTQAGFTMTLPNGTPQFCIYDMGPTPVTNYLDLYSGGGTQPVFHSLNLAAADSQSYNGAGVATNGSGPSNGAYMYQGNFGDSNGNWRSYALWTYAGGTDQLTGVPLSSFQYCDIYLHYWHWYYNAGGTAIIGYTTDTSINHSTEVANGAYNQLSDANWPVNAGIWVSVLGVASIMNAINAGTWHGIILGPGPSNSLTYYGTAYGAASVDPPRIRAGWYA